VGVSSNNSYFTEIEYTGRYQTWYFENFDLGDPLRNGSISYLNLPAVWVRFRMTSDYSNPLDYEGAYLDNIQLRKCMYSVCANTPAPGPAAGIVAAFNEIYTSILDFIDPFPHPFEF
jgi:hypothetical protein